MAIHEQTVLTFPASKGWVVKAALDNAAQMISRMESEGVSAMDGPAGTMTVQVCVALHLPARGAA